MQQPELPSTNILQWKQMDQGHSRSKFVILPDLKPGNTTAF